MQITFVHAYIRFPNIFFLKPVFSELFIHDSGLDFIWT